MYWPQWQRPAAQGDEQWAIVQRAIAATEAFGIEPQLRISSTDANLPISKGIQIGLITLLAEAGMAQ